MYICTLYVCLCVFTHRFEPLVSYALLVMLYFCVFIHMCVCLPLPSDQKFIC